MSADIIKLEIKRLNSCSHGKFILDKDLSTVECGICRLHMNPIEVLIRIVHQENSLLKREAERRLALKETEKRLKTKCNHCGKITPIQYRLSDWKILEESHKNETLK